MRRSIGGRARTNLRFFFGIADRMAFWKKWKEDNDNVLWIINTLGIKGYPAENRFLSGILVATSASKSIFHTTQEVVQADGAHTSFGKYTLFLAYSTTAKPICPASHSGFLFGNEDIKNWTLLWKFVVYQYLKRACFCNLIAIARNNSFVVTGLVK